MVKPNLMKVTFLSTMLTLTLPLAADTPQLKKMRREIALVEGQIEVLSGTLTGQEGAMYHLQNLRSQIEAIKQDIARLKGRLDGTLPPPPPDKQCSYNLKGLGTMVEMWSTKNRGRYPSGLSQLSQSEIKYYVKCPEGKAYHYARDSDSYRLECQGTHRLSYSGISGLSGF